MNRMKATLLPLYFDEANERERDERQAQLAVLQRMYGEEAEFLPPVSVTAAAKPAADAVVFPQLLGAAFRHREELRRLEAPLLILTSSFGTVEMWDWEIGAYLREELELTVFSPYTAELARVILRALGAKRTMRNGLRFLIFQDSPGEGMQANIFKRFYWWEEDCTRRIEEAFGVKFVYRSWEALNRRARELPDEEARELWRRRAVPCEGVGETQLLPAVKLYMALRETIAAVGGVAGVGANCLNESFHSVTTPCLAWNWLYDYDHILWACEGDTVSLISQYTLHSALLRPLMMTNIYPFLVGMAALKHEKIDRFPDIADPDNHALGVHCGYFGFAPRSFCSCWTLRPRVLEIVGEDAMAVDCRMAPGPVTMAKLHPGMGKLTVIEAEIEDYVQYPGSDCRNGALLRYRRGDGHAVMEHLSSHHALLIHGAVTHEILAAATVYGLEVEVL